jgi:hypothetical protein
MPALMSSAPVAGKAAPPPPQPPPPQQQQRIGRGLLLRAKRGQHKAVAPDPAACPAVPHDEPGGTVNEVCFLGARKREEESLFRSYNIPVDEEAARTEKCCKQRRKKETCGKIDLSGLMWGVVFIFLFLDLSVALNLSGDQ